MGEGVFTFLVGGKAGEGVKKTGSVVARLFSDMGRHAFLMDDYQSLIRGGHNFTAVSSATRPVSSHYMKADVVVALDRRSYEAHAGHVKEQGLLVYNSDTVEGVPGIGLPLTTEAKRYPNPSLRLGVGAVTALAVAVGLRKGPLKQLISSEYKRDKEENTAYSMAVYDVAQETNFGRFKLESGSSHLPMVNGNQAIAMGALAGGLDAYYAYPMTPTSGVLHFLAAHDQELGVVAVQPESEIAVINMAIGSAFAGARTMVEQAVEVWH